MFVTHGYSSESASQIILVEKPSVRHPVSKLGASRPPENEDAGY